MRLLLPERKQDKNDSERGASGCHGVELDKVVGAAVVPSQFNCRIVQGSRRAN